MIDKYFTNLKLFLWVPYDQVSIKARDQDALLVAQAAQLGCFPAEEADHISQLKTPLTG